MAIEPTSPSQTNEQLDGEADPTWLLITAVRETFSVATRAQVTYRRSVQFALELAPVLISGTEYMEAFETRDERLYRERAAAQSALERRNVSPLTLLNTDLAQRELELGNAPTGSRVELEDEVRRLRRTREILDESQYTETRAILRDSEISALIGTPTDVPIQSRGPDYKQYNLTNSRVLRTRVFHPDPIEWKTGVDLVYEHYRIMPTGEIQIRFVACQYKIWDQKAIYETAQPNLIQQMERAIGSYCTFCRTTDSGFHLPRCTAFMRLTNKTQTRRGFQATIGWSVPLCKARDNTQRTAAGNKVIYVGDIADKSLSQHSFHELFNRNMLGSPWISQTALQEFYNRLGVEYDSTGVFLHAQELPIEAASENDERSDE